MEFMERIDRDNFVKEVPQLLDSLSFGLKVMG
jgi:hypothetical protein